MQLDTSSPRNRRPAGRRIPRGWRLVPVIAALLAGCDQNGQSTSVAPSQVQSTPAPSTPRDTPPESTTSAQDPAGEGPVLQFEKTLHDFGQTSDAGSKLAYGFKFKNTGTETLVIDRVKTNCGCTAANLTKKTFEPGEGDTIQVSFKPLRSGYQTQEITVVSNAIDARITRVKIAATVTRFVELDPPMLKFGLVEVNEEHRMTFVVKCSDPGSMVEKIETTSSHVMARPAENAIAAQMPPGHFLVEATLDPRLPWGPFQARLTIWVRGSPANSSEQILHDVPMRVDIDAYGDVVATPGKFRMGAAPGTTFERIIKLTHRDGKPFNIEHLELRDNTLKEMAVKWEPFDENGERGCKLILTGKADGPEEFLIEGTVAYTTDLADEPERVIGIIGVVRTVEK